MRISSTSGSGTQVVYYLWGVLSKSQIHPGSLLPGGVLSTSEIIWLFKDVTQTYRRTDRQTDRETDGQTDRDRERERESQRQTETDRKS